MEENNNSPIEDPVVEEPTETPKSRFVIWQLVGLALVIFGLGMAAGYFIWARPLETKLAETQQALDAAQVAADQQAAADNTQQQVKRYDVPIDDDPILGPDTAQITIIEFSDFECPYCQKWQVEVLPRLLDKYGDQIRLVYRDFPLIGLHDNAAPAAEAAQCANEQNQYWAFHDLLFNGNLGLNRKAYDSYAQSLNLDMAQFSACLDERRFQNEVEADYNFAGQLGVQSTPTFFINGLALVGAQPYEVFEQVIDMELAGEIP